jgi:hypothetical protein
VPWGLVLKAGPWLALALAGVVIWGLWGRLEGANLKLAAAETVIKQREEDMKLSAVIVAQQAQALSNLKTKVVTVTERIYSAPITRACVDSPSMRAANIGVRDIILQGGGPATRREPPKPLH